MTEKEARAWLAERYNAVELERLQRLVDLVRDEAPRQNLIAPSTMDHIWARHVVDSAQLERLAPANAATWVDVGTGAGFPGIVIACVRPSKLVLVEPRRRRADFLQRVIEDLALRNAEVHTQRVERLTCAPAEVISARAVASLDDLFTWTTRIRGPSTVYVLPKGGNGRNDVEAIRSKWQGMFHVEQSVTDSASVIVVASGVEPACTA